MFRPKDLAKFIDEAEKRSQNTDFTPNLKKLKNKDSFCLSFIDIFDKLSVADDENYKKIKKELIGNAKQSKSTN